MLDLREVAYEMTQILGRLMRDDIELSKVLRELCRVKVDVAQSSNSC